MIRALFTASTGMQAQQLTIDVISNNLANVSTVGFRKSRADFQDLLYETVIPAGTASAQGNEIPTGLQLGHGVRPVATQKIFREGDFRRTDNELDLAIEGDGFFAVTQPNGELAYTRSGALKLNSQGQMVTSEGFLLSPNITVPSTAINVTIGSDGTVTVISAGAAAPSQIGAITLARFPNPAGLSSLGRNLFMPTQASGAATTGTPGEGGFGTIAQGFLENSNVSVIEEMVGLIEAQRAYEINSRAIQTSDELLQTAANLKR